MSKDPNTYDDCRRVFDLALQRGGIKVALANHAAAVRFRHRMYSFRKLLFEEAVRASIVPGIVPANPYTKFVITILDNVVFVKERDIPGEITDLDDNPVTLSDADPLLEEARNLRLNLGDDE